MDLFDWDIHPEAIQQDRRIRHNTRQNLAYAALIDTSPLGRPEAGHYRNGFNHHIQIIDADLGWYRLERPELAQPCLGKRWLARVKPGTNRYQYLPVVEIDVGFEKLGNMWYGERRFQARQTRPHPTEYTDKAKKVPKKRGFVKDEVVFLEVKGRWVLIPPNTVRVGPSSVQHGILNAPMMVGNHQMPNAPMIASAPQAAKAPQMAQVPPTANKAHYGGSTGCSYNDEWSDVTGDWV
jgi:hypothetical protein